MSSASLMLAGTAIMLMSCLTSPEALFRQYV